MRKLIFKNALMAGQSDSKQPVYHSIIIKRPIIEKKQSLGFTEKGIEKPCGPKLLPPQLKAICRKDVDPRREKIHEELTLGEVYIPDYMVIGRSWSQLLIREHPGIVYNPVMFDFVDDDRVLSFHIDFVKPIMDRYRDYLWNELMITGTWEVFVKMNDDPVYVVSEKNRYRIVRYGTWELESVRPGDPSCYDK